MLKISKHLYKVYCLVHNAHKTTQYIWVLQSFMHDTINIGNYLKEENIIIPLWPAKSSNIISRLAYGASWT